MIAKKEQNKVKSDGKNERAVGDLEQEGISKERKSIKVYVTENFPKKKSFQIARNLIISDETDLLQKDFIKYRRLIVEAMKKACDLKQEIITLEKSFETAD